MALRSAVVLLAIWPGPSGLIDFIARPIRAHMPPDAKLIAVGVFSPFFVPLKVLMMAGGCWRLPWLMYQIWAFVAPGLYSHEKKFALPLIFFGSMLAYIGIAFVQFFVLDKMFAFIQAVHARQCGGHAGHRVLCRGHTLALFGLWHGLPGAHRGDAARAHSTSSRIEKLRSFRGYFIVLSFVIAAVITPPDVISQLALAIPMCLLYEAGILAAGLVHQGVQHLKAAERVCRIHRFESLSVLPSCRLREVLSKR
jgi:sec-independent protein translocase protein TatC